MSRLDQALAQSTHVRQYTLNLIDSFDPGDWFKMPKEGVTHLAWQVGHLAVAEYWLTMNRVRGRKDEDATLLPESFMKQFGRESNPDLDPKNNPSPTELRAVLDRVHEQALKEVRAFPEAEWDQPVSRPHPMFKTKLDAIAWSPLHEMVHAGQIGLLRRLFGKPPLW